MLGSWGRGVDDFVEMIFGATTQNADAFPPEVLDVYKDAFRPVGALTPPIEYYRNMDRNWELTADDRGPHDRRAVPDDLRRGRSRAHARDDGRHGGARPRSRTVVIENCGHWTQQERPHETSQAMLAYLRRLPPWH